MTYHHTDPQECFEHAIGEGVLSDDSSDPNFAAMFMYIHSDDRFDYFKHRATRQYVKSPLVC
jgi:hypothetical protein